MRSLSCSHSARYLNTLSRHSRLNSATPSASISLLAADAELLLDLDLDRQAVRVPSRLARHAKSLHRAVAAEEILDRAREDVMDARAAVRRRRALEEHELGPTRTVALDTCKQTGLCPAREDFGLETVRRAIRSQ